MYEDIYYKSGQEYPYDSSPSGRSRKGDWAIKAARGVLSNLCDRRDIKRGFEGIDHAVRKEIVDSLAEIIRIAALDQAPTPEPREPTA